MECDRLSALHDDILTSHIFSNLSLRDAVRTSIFSSRWRFLWKQIPHLDFSKHFFQTLNSSSQNWSCNEKVKYVNDAIDNILLLHAGHIQRFSISLHPCLLQPELRVEQWVHHAALNQVKHLSLKMSCVMFDVPPSLFSCHLLRDLELESFRFPEIPTHFGGFPFLQSCYLSHLLCVTEDALKQLIGLCPLLRKLVVANCGFINLKIQAPNLNFLNIIGCHDLESLAVDCPQLVELEIACGYKLIEFKIPKQHPMLNSLRKLSIKACPKILDRTLLTILGCFYNLEEVYIKICGWQIYEKDHPQQERAKGEVVANLTFPSVKKASIDISISIKKDEAVMLAFLLDHAPSLKDITVFLRFCTANIHAKEFIKKVLGLQKMNEKVDIRMIIDEEYVNPSCLLSDANSWLNSNDPLDCDSP